VGKRVVLIDPKGWGFGLNIGLGYLAATLAAAGHNVQVIDTNNRRGNVVRRLQKALVSTPDFIGISMFTSHNIKDAAEVISICRKITGTATRYIAGGIGVTLSGAKMFGAYPGLFDVLVKGDGEYSLVDIVNGKDLSKIDGIIYQENGQVIENRDRATTDLNMLPFPLYEAFDYLPSFDFGIYDIMTSRGCPYNCVFCLNKMISHRRFRARPAEDVVDEMEHAITTFGIKRFQIQDDNFLLDANRATQICDQIIGRKLNTKLYLFGGVRADRLTAQLAEKLKLAGCRFAMVGIENGDRETFAKVRKDETLDDIANAVSMLKSNNITAKGTAIIGLIDTTFDSDMRSMEFVKSLGIDSTWHHAFPYEGTELYDWVSTNGKFLYSSKYILGDQFPVSFETPEYSAVERDKAFTIACIVNHQYARPLIGFSPFKMGEIRKLLRVLHTVWVHNKKNLPMCIYDLLVDVTKRAIYSTILPVLPHNVYPFLVSVYERLRWYMNKYE